MKEENNKVDKVFEMVEDKEKEFNINDEVCPRIEKYPDLPEDEFIPIEYTHKKKGKINQDPDYQYLINKKGEVKNKRTNNILKPTKTISNYNKYQIYITKYDSICVSAQILVANTFLINSNPNKFTIVNHIDHNPSNNILSNLEFITRKGNSSIKFGKSLGKCDSKLLAYVGKNSLGEIVYRFNKKTIPNELSKNCIGMIEYSIRKNTTYKGLIWTISKKKKDTFFNIIGYSGNINDYIWYKHPFYKYLYVCENGFILSKRITSRGNTINTILGHINKNGYIRVDVIDINSGKTISTTAHRVIMEFIIGKHLTSENIIDHKNTIRYDNSFNNLELTDFKGNMNNPNTLNKIKNKYIVLDLFGNVVFKGDSKETYKFVFNRELPNNFCSSILTSNKILNNSFICFNLNIELNFSKLNKKLSNVYYLIDEKTKIIVGVYTNLKDLSKSKFLKENLNYDKLKYRYKKDKSITINGYKILKGLEAKDILIANGHLNILKELQTEKDTINKNQIEEK